MKFEPGFQEAIITSAKREVKDSRSSGITLGSRGYFFLIDTDGSFVFFFCVNAASVLIRKKYPLEPRVIS